MYVSTSVVIDMLTVCLWRQKNSESKIDLKQTSTFVTTVHFDNSEYPKVMAAANAIRDGDVTSEISRLHMQHFLNTLTMFVWLAFVVYHL